MQFTPHCHKIFFFAIAIVMTRGAEPESPGVVATSQEFFSAIWTTEAKKVFFGKVILTALKKVAGVRIWPSDGR